jgi:flagellum-specific ATP synthase
MSLVQPVSIKKFNKSQLAESFNTVGFEAFGKVTDVKGHVIEAHLPRTSVGTVVAIDLGRTAANSAGDSSTVLGEVIGFRDEYKVTILPYGNTVGIAPGCAVKIGDVWNQIHVTDALLGRILGPMLNPLDGLAPVDFQNADRTSLDQEAPNPMLRTRIDKTMPLGVKAIDGLLTFGEGQRIGIMAGAGVGKSVLLGMIARNAAADVNIIGLIGERGREVREFIERDLGPEGLKRSVVIVTTSDQSPLLRVRAAKAVTALAEGFSARGKKVLLFMDSLTRVAMAQREIGQARQETPTAKGYTTSVFSLLPALLERCGPQPEGKGSISGIYTVLVDGDDFNDPIPDAARSILDGQIQLSRALANKGHFPAIDLAGSISRVMNDIISDEHKELALTIRALLGTYKENQDYVQIGAYQTGTNTTLDAAISLMPAIERFLKQGITESSDFQSTLKQLSNIFRVKPQPN